VRWAVCLAVAAMVAISAWQRWLILDATPFPVGVDGYFYPIQVRSLLEHGTLAYPSSPLTFWWMAPFAAVTGDPIVGAKLGAALGCALVGVPAYFLGKRLGGVGGGLIAAALATSSAGSAYLTFEFVKQGIGITLGTLSTNATCRLQPREMLRPRGTDINLPQIGVVCLAAIATLLAHKLAFVIFVILAAPTLVVRARSSLFGRRLIYAVVGAVAAVIVLAVAGTLMPQRLPSLADLDLLRGLFAAPHWSLPALVAPHATLTFRHEAAIAGVICVVAAIVLRRCDDPFRRALGWPVVALGLAIALPWLAVEDPQGLGFRLRIIAFVPMALGAAIVAGALPIPRRDAVLAVLAAGIFALGATRDLTAGEVVMHPALAAATANAAGKIPPGATVIVPERRILYPVQWYTRAPVSLRPEPVPYAHRVRLFGLAFIGGEGSPLDRALDDARREPSIDPPIGLHPNYRNGLVLVTEPTWDWLLARLPDDTRRYFERWPTL
jgi:hypothetical protein